MKCPKCNKELWGVQYLYSNRIIPTIMEWCCPAPSILKSHYRIGAFSNKSLVPRETEIK